MAHTTPWQTLVFECPSGKNRLETAHFIFGAVPFSLETALDWFFLPTGEGLERLCASAKDAALWWEAHRRFARTSSYAVSFNFYSLL